MKSHNQKSGGGGDFPVVPIGASFPMRGRGTPEHFTVHDPGAGLSFTNAGGNLAGISLISDDIIGDAVGKQKFMPAEFSSGRK